MEPWEGAAEAENRLSLAADHVHSLSCRLEDLLFRAQRVAHALKRNAPSHDRMFGEDLNALRRDVRAFNNELEEILRVLTGLARPGPYKEEYSRHAQTVNNRSHLLVNAVAALHEQALLAHQHIRQADHRSEAWYLTQEAERLVEQCQPFPSITTQIVIWANAHTP